MLSIFLSTIGFIRNHKSLFKYRHAGYSVSFCLMHLASYTFWPLGCFFPTFFLFNCVLLVTNWDAWRLLEPEVLIKAMKCKKQTDSTGLQLRRVLIMCLCVTVLLIGLGRSQIATRVKWKLKNKNVDRCRHTEVTGAHATHFLLCNMVISRYEGMESQSNQAPVGMPSTSTPANSGAFIMMNAANIQRMGPLVIDFQQQPNGKYDHPNSKCKKNHNNPYQY